MRRSNRGKFKLIVLVSTIFTTGSIVTGAKENNLTYSQQWRADYIAEKTSENWEKYGVLPSVAVGQAFIESSLGKHCPNYNLWGIRSGKAYYGSLDEGIKGYLKVINNGYYPNAPFTKDYRTQLSRILAGGYCQPVGNYYSDAINSIEKYEWDKYDEELFETLEEKKQLKKLKKRMKKWDKPFKIIYNDDVPWNEIWVNGNIIEKGAVLVYNDENHLMLQGIYDAVKKKRLKYKGNILETSDERLVGEKMYIEVKEETKG